MKKVIDYANENNLTLIDVFNLHMGKGCFLMPVMGEIRLMWAPNADFEIGGCLELEYVRVPKRLEKSVFYRGSVKLDRVTESEIINELVFMEIPIGGGFSGGEYRAIDGYYYLKDSKSVIKDGTKFTQDHIATLYRAFTGGGNAQSESQKEFLHELASNSDDSNFVGEVFIELDGLYISAEAIGTGSNNPKPKLKAATRKRYNEMQKRVDEYYSKHRLLSHSAICTRLAPEFNCAAETIRKNTNLTKC